MAVETVPDTSGDVVVTDQDLYDHATTDTPAPAPAPAVKAEAPQPTPQQPTPDQDGRPRDEQGRFAPKPAQQATTQQPAQPQQPQPQPQQPQQRQPEDHRVPVATLLQERERAYKAEAELQQMRQAWAQWQHQQQLAQQQATTQQSQAPQTIYDDPDQYLQHRVIAPLQQQMQHEVMLVKEGMSREVANREFGIQMVNTAIQAIGQIRHTPHGDFVFKQIMGSGHPYGALVAWFNQARAQQAIGSDPNAWFQNKRKELVKDPQHQREVFEYVRSQQQQQRGNGRPPNVQLPPSLSSMPASSGRLEDEGDLSNESLYAFATRPR